MKATTFQSLVVGLLCLAAAGLSGALYNQHQRVAKLQATADKSAQRLDGLLHDADNLRNTQQTLGLELKELRLAVDSGAQQAITLDPLLDQWAHEIQELHDGLAARANKTELSALQTRIKDVERQLQALKSKPPSAAASRPRKPRKAARAPHPAPPSPPFEVLGIESRGGERFLTTAPLNNRSLTEVRLLHSGERIGSWQLKTLGATTAIFTVRDRPDQIIPLP